MVVGGTGTTVSNRISRGKALETYFIDGKYISEKEGIKLIKQNLKKMKIRSYPDYLRWAKKMGQLNGYKSIWEKS